MTTRTRSPLARALLSLAALLPLPAAPVAAQATAQPAPSLDVTQAYLMLDVLTGIRDGEHDPERTTALLSSEGTELIVGQLNLARRVSAEQYSQLILGLMEGVRPDIQPVDSTRRAARGVDALVDDVWPRLGWALDHLDVLRQRVDHLRDLDFYDRAYSTSTRFLPGPMEMTPRLFAVMGGRAGGAKIGSDRIYLDVLAYSYRDRREGTFPADAELIKTIAHEMHHMGYDHYLARTRAASSLGEAEGLMYGFVASLLSEGSATYLISEDRNLQGMRQSRSYAGYLERGEELLATSEDILRRISEGEIGTREELRAATADLLGNWTHATGSLMLGVIDEGGGLERVMDVVADPRRLLHEYNRAARSLASSVDVYLFDDELAERLLRMGG